MERKWTCVLAAAGALVGMVVGKTLADQSAFCAPGLLQGNPICILLLLFGIVAGSIGLAAAGAVIGRLIDGRPEEGAADSGWRFTPGPAMRAGAQYGLFLTVGSYFLIWLTTGLEGVVALQKHPWGWAIIVPIVLGIGAGYFVDRGKTL
jgi:hypothetical protein